MQALRRPKFLFVLKYYDIIKAFIMPPQVIWDRTEQRYGGWRAGLTRPWLNVKCFRTV